MNHLLRTLVVSTLAFGTLSQALAQQAPASAASAAKPSMTITTARALQGNLPVRLAANGNIAAWQEASVGAEANGLRLAEVRVGVGDVVQRGQVLAVFASESIAADAAQARAAVAEAQAQLADAAANAQRARAFEQNGMMSKQQIGQLLTGEQTAAARLESAKAMLAVQEIRLKNTQVRAPDSGIISVRLDRASRVNSLFCSCVSTIVGATLNLTH